MNKQEILELIQQGFAPELIQLEFNVPIEKIQKYINQDNSEKEAAKKVKEQEIAQSKVSPNTKKHAYSSSTTSAKTANQQPTTASKSNSSSRLDIIREKYNTLTHTKSTKSLDTKVATPTSEEIQKANQLITNLKTQLQEIEKISTEALSTISSLSPQEQKEKRIANRKQKRETLIQMLEGLKSIEKTPTTFEQSLQIEEILLNKSLENLSISREDKINLKLAKARKTIATKIANQADALASQTDDIQQLRYLYSHIPDRVNGLPNMYTSSIKYRIDSKANNLHTQELMYKIRNDISPDIDAVIRSIAENQFDEETAKKAISEEAKRRVANAPKNMFALTEERQEKQVQFQIRTVLSEQGKKYPITNPGTAMNNLMIISPELPKEQALSEVIENLSSQGKYEEAKSLAEKYISVRNLDTEESSISIAARRAYKSVVLKQIGEMILEQIKKPSKPEEDEVFMNLLEKKLQDERTSPSQIPLEFDASHSKRIYLSSVWYEKPNKHR